MSEESSRRIEQRMAELSQVNASLQAEMAELKRAEETLRASEHRLRSLIEHTSDAVFCYEYDPPIPTALAVEEQIELFYRGVLAECNDVCARSYGAVHGQEVVGQKLTDLFGTAPGSLDGFFRAFIQNGYRTVDAEGTEILPDGTERYFLNNGHGVIEDGVLLRVWGTFRDITERKLAEEELGRYRNHLEELVQERTAALEAANRELEAFAYSVSHDLRAPLRAMDGFSHILLDEHAPQLASEAQRYLELVRENAQQMSHLIEDLLSFSRLGWQDPHKQTVSPRGLVGQALQDLRAEQRDRQVEVVIDDLPPCQADPALLRQVYANLLSNALKFTRERKAARIEVGCERREGEVVYYVRDNGVGFDMRYADKLFGVFQRLHSAQEYEGTGVGLAIVQRIVHRHGGRVWAEAKVGEGATFYFTV